MVILGEGRSWGGNSNPGLPGFVFYYSPLRYFKFDHLQTCLPYVADCPKVMKKEALLPLH